MYACRGVVFFVNKFLRVLGLYIFGFNPNINP